MHMLSKHIRVVAHAVLVVERWTESSVLENLYRSLLVNPQGRIPRIATYPVADVGNVEFENPAFELAR